MMNNNFEYQDRIKEINEKIRIHEVTYGVDSVERMMKVLQHLEIIDSQNIPLIKSRVAREIGGGDENIYLTQILMEGVLNLLEPSEIVACISIYYAQGRESGTPQDFRDLDIPDRLVEALELCEKSYNEIREVEIEEGIIDGGESSILNFCMVKPVYEWSKGLDFIEIMEFTTLLEGSIIKTIQRIDMALRNVNRALALIGNTTLCAKIDKASVIIKRDIAFALSLYIEEVDMKKGS